MQTGVGALLAARMGYISIAENERYADLAEANRISSRLIPPRRGWIVDRYGQPMAVNNSDFRIDLIPDQLEDVEQVMRVLTEILGLDAETLTRIRRDLRGAAGFQPVPVAEHLAFDKFAAVTVRLPELHGVSPLRAFSRSYPEGAAVGHLIGYVGTPNREDYEAEDRNPLLIAPGFKVGKEGLEKVMEQRLRGRPGAGAGRGYRARPAGAGASHPPRPAGSAAAGDDRRRLAELRGAPARRGIGRLRDPRLPERRHPLHGLDAGLRSQHFLRRHRPCRNGR